MVQAGVGLALLESKKGLVVTEVVKDGAAWRSKLVQKNDVLLAVDNRPVATGNSLQIRTVKEPPKRIVPFVSSIAPGKVPERVDLRKWMSPVEQQMSTHSCCANAAAGAYEYLCKRVAHQHNDELGDISRLFIYYVGRKADMERWGDPVTTPLEDDGMTITGAIDALQLKGACLERNWPFELSSINRCPPAGCFSEAMRYKIRDAVEVPVDLAAMKQALAQGYPIICGLRLTRQFVNPGPTGVVPMPAAPAEANHGAHCVLLVGYSDAQRVFIVRNSWGPSHGDGGYDYVPYAYAASRDYNLGEEVGQWTIRSLDDYDLTPESPVGGDAVPLFDAAAAAGWEAPPCSLVSLRPVRGGGGGAAAAAAAPAAAPMAAVAEEEEGAAGLEDMFDPRAEARRAFDAIDVDDSGYLDRAELARAFRLVGQVKTAEEIDEVMRRYDTSGDGRLSFAEFLPLAAQLAPPDASDGP